MYFESIFEIPVSSIIASFDGPHIADGHDAPELLLAVLIVQVVILAVLFGYKVHALAQSSIHLESATAKKEAET